MFRHIVLLTLREDATEADRDAIVAELRTLPDLVPTIRAYDIGLDAGLNAGNATISVVADFDDADGYLTYRDHPDHQRVIAEHIAPVLAARSAIQYERVG